MRRTMWLAVAVVVVAGACVPVGPGGGPQPTDCVHWRYGPADEPAPGVLPPELDRDSYKVASRRDPRPELFSSPHNHCGQKGPALDLAFGVTKGRGDVVIAVLDSGIKWRDAGAMADLARQAYINVGEARPPCAAPSGDCNGDGRFDIADFGAIPDRNGNGVADPEDLILDPAYNNGVDDDHNGHVDDISGWDFLYGDNNPLDTVGYGHGTGEAEDSTAAANGTGSVGTCPGCRFLPVRVSDSFIADGGRFAAGVLFALDSGADVIQEALGAISNPPQAQQAIDAAYRRNVVVVASMADEAAKHPNLPSSLEHTMAVNSVTEKQDILSSDVRGYLALNGCTNFGGHTFIGIPSGSCSSEATGRAAGMVGLIESVARDTNRVLTANEVMQMLRATADDVDFSTPNDVDPANDFGTPTGGLIDTVRYPTTPLWDATFGYGRVNIYEAVKGVRNGRIPPEADIRLPRWFEVMPARGTVAVRGRVAAPHASTYDFRLEWAKGLQPPLYPKPDVWRVVARRNGLQAPYDGVLGTLDLARIAAALPNGGTGTPVDPKSGRPAEERFTVRLRVVVTAHGGDSDQLTGEHQKQVFVHDDPQLMPGYPRFVAGASTASPVFANLDGKKGDELVVATDDGYVHAYRPDGSEIPGWPVHGTVPGYWPRGSRTARALGIAPPNAAISAGAPVVTDLDGNGTLEVVASDTDGNVWAWEHTGRRRAGFGLTVVDGRPVSQVHVDPAFSLDDPALGKNMFNRTKRGIAAAPAAGDLDGDGRLEIVAAALDRHVYAWHDNGTPVAGFPVLLVDPTKVASVAPVTQYVTFRPDAGAREGGELIATPSLGDLTGDGRPEIVVGAQEEYAEPINVGSGADVLALLSVASPLGNTRLYAISPDGTNAALPDPLRGTPARAADAAGKANTDARAYLPGWPAALGMLQLEALPTIGDGVSIQAVIGDVSRAAGPEVVASSAAGPLYVLNAHGDSVYGTVDGKDVPLLWSGGLNGQDNARFGANRNSSDIVASSVTFGGASIGRINGDTKPDVTAPTAGLTRLIDILAADLQLPNDDHLMAWRTSDGNALPGFPRTTADLAFFVTPAIADLDGDGHNETIAGNGLYTLNAYNATGARPRGWPKLTGGWLVGTPGLGDWRGDGHVELAVVRRDGYVLVWRTQATPAALTEWPRYGGSGTNSGAYSP
jgi:hypothetical protein